VVYLVDVGLGAEDFNDGEAAAELVLEPRHDGVHRRHATKRASEAQRNNAKTRRQCINNKKQTEFLLSAALPRSHYQEQRGKKHGARNAIAHRLHLA
jgi:hypothetical protein